MMRKLSDRAIATRGQRPTRYRITVEFELRNPRDYTHYIAAARAYFKDWNDAANCHLDFVHGERVDPYAQGD